jgi:hypothetical protein
MALCLFCFVLGGAAGDMADFTGNSEALYSGTLRCGISMPTHVERWPGTGGSTVRRPIYVRRWVSVDDLEKLNTYR